MTQSGPESNPFLPLGVGNYSVFVSGIPFIDKIVPSTEISDGTRPATSELGAVSGGGSENTLPMPQPSEPIVSTLDETASSKPREPENRSGEAHSEAFPTVMPSEPIEPTRPVSGHRRATRPAGPPSIQDLLDGKMNLGRSGVPKPSALKPVTERSGHLRATRPAGPPNDRVSVQPEALTGVSNFPGTGSSEFATPYPATKSKISETQRDRISSSLEELAKSAQANNGAFRVSHVRIELARLGLNDPQIKSVLDRLIITGMIKPLLPGYTHDDGMPKIFRFTEKVYGQSEKGSSASDGVLSDKDEEAKKIAELLATNDVHIDMDGIARFGDSWVDFPLGSDGRPVIGVSGDPEVESISGQPVAMNGELLGILTGKLGDLPGGNQAEAMRTETIRNLIGRLEAGNRELATTLGVSTGNVSPDDVVQVVPVQAEISNLVQPSNETGGTFEVQIIEEDTPWSVFSGDREGFIETEIGDKWYVRHEDNRDEETGQLIGKRIALYQVPRDGEYLSEPTRVIINEFEPWGDLKDKERWARESEESTLNNMPPILIGETFMLVPPSPAFPGGLTIDKVKRIVVGEFGNPAFAEVDRKISELIEREKKLLLSPAPPVPPFSDVVVEDFSGQAGGLDAGTTNFEKDREPGVMARLLGRLARKNR